MNENFLEMMRLKDEADKLIEKVNSDTQRTVEKIAEDRTIGLNKMAKDLREIQEVVFRFGLADCGGYYSVNTELKSIIDKNTTITINFNSKEYRSRICLMHIDTNGNGRYGYGGINWSLIHVDKFPVSKNGNLSDYNTDVLNLIDNWMSVKSAVERNLMNDCNKSIERSMKTANELNEKVKSQIGEVTNGRL